MQHPEARRSYSKFITDKKYKRFVNFRPANTAQSLSNKRRIAIVVIFIIAAILTPPDVLSQVGLAVPMLILYELSILVCRYIEKKKTKSNA